MQILSNIFRLSKHHCLSDSGANKNLLESSRTFLATLAKPHANQYVNICLNFTSMHVTHLSANKRLICWFVSNPFKKFVIQNEGKLIFLCAASWKVMKGPYSMQKHWRLPTVYCWNPLYVIPSCFTWSYWCWQDSILFISITTELHSFIFIYPWDMWIVTLTVFLKNNNKTTCFTKFSWTEFLLHGICFTDLVAVEVVSSMGWTAWPN